MKKVLMNIMVMLFCVLSGFSQVHTGDTTINFNLDELKNLAVKQSYEIQNADLEVKKAKAKKWETTAMGLPQISASANYQNFPDIPTQLMPNFIAPAVYDVNTNAFGLTPLVPFQGGGKMPVQFGSKHNTDWKLSVGQLIFSGEYIVGLKASGIYLSLSREMKEKNILQVKENIEKTWYLILITEESIKVSDSVYKNLKKLYTETEEYYKAGFLEETDAEQLKLNMQNVENSLLSLKQQKEILYKLLKFQAGIDFDKKISISGSLNDLVTEIEESNILSDEFDINKNIDYKLVQIQENLSELSLQREKTKYLPTLNAFYSYSKKAMTDSLDLITESENWYPTSVWGLQLNIPIFSSGQRYAKVKQAQFDLEQKKVLRKKTKQAILLDNAQTRSDYQTALNTLKNKAKNKHLAEKIYKNTLLKYKEGTVSSLTLTQSQTQYFQALSEYYKALGDLTGKHIKLKKIMNKL